MTLELDTEILCGQLVVGGFAGVELPARYERALREGRRGGAILFRRNLPDIATSAALCRAIAGASRADLPPFLGVDQEGGRVSRLPAPFLTLPPMRTLGALNDLALVRRAARAVAVELGALGFNLNFSPVLDVDSNPDNPIIGERAFGVDPDTVARCGVAFLEGMQEVQVLACGKHFPGHGDTSVDSHVGLPVIAHDRDRLERVELVPFRAAARAGVAAMMSAHVVCEGLDPRVPATLSRTVCEALLRGDIGFEGVLFSDDLEMGALAPRYRVEESAVEAVRAGCDALLICSDEDAQDRAHEALVRAAERDRRFRDRCAEAASRGLRARRLCPPRPASAAAVAEIVGAPASVAVADELRRAAQSRKAQR